MEGQRGVTCLLRQRTEPGQLSYFIPRLLSGVNNGSDPGLVGRESEVLLIMNGLGGK